MFPGEQDPVHCGRGVSEEASPPDGAREQIAAPQLGENDPEAALAGHRHRRHPGWNALHHRRPREGKN